MTSALKKFFERQSLASTSVSGAITIKVEPSYIAEDNHLPESNEESVLLTRSNNPTVVSSDSTASKLNSVSSTCVQQQ